MLSTPGKELILTFSINRPLALRRPWGVALIALAGCVAIAAIAAPAADAKKRGGPKVTVMTSNLFLGADLTPAIESTDLGGAIDASGVIYNDVVASDFPDRAVALAKEIKRSKADLVGLQEVAKWFVQTPSDGGAPDTGGFGAPATVVKYDFLKLLQKELKAIDAKYKVVGVQVEFEAELPADTDGSDLTGGISGADLDARLQIRDVILAKKGSKVKLGKVKSANFSDANLFTPEIAGFFPLPVERGWVSVEASVKSKGTKYKFRFVNTHLEAFDSSFRLAQAKEMIAKGGPLKTKKQVIFVGDINSGSAKDKVFGDDQSAYKAFTGFGLKNLGARHSCCVSDLMTSGPSGFDHTVDHVMVKPKIKQKKAYIIGEEISDRTPSGLWPSDHAAVVSKLQLKK